MTQSTNPDEIHQAVRNYYGTLASLARESVPLAPEATTAGQCCSAEPQGSCCSGDPDALTSELYDLVDLVELPPAAVLAAHGCGNPTALAELRAGEVVLDLGSGAGIDVLLSARRVGPTGFAYGLDMTDEMLELAERNAAERGATNVRFLKGDIEHVPLPDASVDVLISNCVINLSADKEQVLHEAFRVLRPGGRFAVADVVVQGTLPMSVRLRLDLWAGCIAGALEEKQYRQLLAAVGFEAVDVEVTRVYSAEELYDADEAGQAAAQLATFAALEASGTRLVSAFVRAAKPRPKRPSPSIGITRKHVRLARAAEEHFLSRYEL
jgi:ubiquinone/menaquinone biosynthesis C-methylase UbiE